jgi:hypothetical protein
VGVGHAQHTQRLDRSSGGWIELVRHGGIVDQLNLRRYGATIDPDQHFSKFDTSIRPDHNKLASFEGRVAGWRSRKPTYVTHHTVTNQI